MGTCLATCADILQTRKILYANIGEASDRQVTVYHLEMEIIILSGMRGLFGCLYRQINEGVLDCHGAPSYTETVIGIKIPA